MSILEVNPQKLVEEVAKDLKPLLQDKKPEWVDYVKTGVHKERPPLDPDWYYYRAASILKNVYKFGPIGVEKLRRKYGGRKNRGYKPEHTYKAGGKIIRVILQQLEELGLVTKSQKGTHKGRVATPKGISLLTKAANRIKKGNKS